MGKDADDETNATDSQLAARCQELEAELAKLLEVNQEIYDRALEMEERVIQLEAKITDMEEESEQLTLQLQNSWHLGYKKGQHDAESQGAKGSAESAKVERQAAPSIKSMIDFEMPPEEKSALEARVKEQGHDTAENPPVFGENEVVAEQQGETGEHKSIPSISQPPAAVPAASSGEPTPSYNDRIYNAVEEASATNPNDAYGAMSWREVETIYQYSAGNNAAGPSLLFEPLAPGQAVGPRTAETNEGAAPAGRKETQPIVVPLSADDPPILKADAASPKFPNKPGSTYSSLAAQKKLENPDPPMELTMHQFLGDTDSYLSLDRVTLEPQPEGKEDEKSGQNLGRSSQEETQTLQGARAQLEAMTRAAKADKNAPDNQTANSKTTGGASASNSQSTLSGLPAQPAHPQDDANSQINPFDNRHADQAFEDRVAAASEAQSAQANADRQNSSMATTGPQEAKWIRRDANATYDGLNALESDSTLDVLDLEKLDIFEGLEDIDELSQIEVIEDVIIPGITPPVIPPAPVQPTKGKYKTSEHVPVVSTDDLHDLIKSRIKKAEEPHEPHRAEGFITGAHDKVDKNAAKEAVAKDLAKKDGAPEPSQSPTKDSADKTVAPAEGTSADGTPAVPTAKELEALRQGARNKFVGGSKGAAPSGTASSVSNDSLGSHAGASAAPPPVASSRTVPPEIRKACMILGVRPEDMTLKEVHEKWKAQMAGGAHPDQGGDTESAIYLNTAKDTLVKWLNDQAPKLGKKFGK